MIPLTLASLLALCALHKIPARQVIGGTLLLLGTFATAREPRVVIIGDSTVSTYSADREIRGWGQMIPRFFDSRVAFDNRAISGRSAKTFITEGDWAASLDMLGPNDYVLIQFGHNDSHHPARPESTDAFGDYRTFLQQYIDDSRARGAIPVLITPMHRKSFDGGGKLLPYIVDKTGHTNNLLPYATAMREVARSNNVICVDLFELSGGLLQNIGAKATAEFLAPKDATHWNERGALAMASLVARGLADRDEALRKRYRESAARSLSLPGSTSRSRTAPVASATPGSSGDFPLVASGVAGTIVYSAEDATVVDIAANLLADDIERVSGIRPSVATSASGVSGPLVLIGTLGSSPELDALAASGRIDVSEIKGGWERYRIEVVDEPWPGAPQALVVAGSDRRGTAYGALSLSEAMGVSPWIWWADSSPAPMKNIHVGEVPFTSKAPSVRYRGIFINDEDWGLQPWAAKTYEPETGDIGPKTYAKIFELLLRLKANYCWPAMHPSTRAFNFYPDNKRVADDYAIVMGSSHCEPMLRNNVDEWNKAEFGDWNPVTNLETILAYWDQRVRENSAFENVFTVGMRGIHDSGMPGGGTFAEKRERLEKIIDLQREILARHVDPQPERVPQLFCAYKEVLEIYRSGMALPDDITFVWANDNYGYTRQLPSREERGRSGGHGLYYHLSYWGLPHDYLWLESNAPALIWHELTKAYAFGVRQLWVANVGDIKPAETGLTLFMRLAWDIEAYGPDVQRTFLRDFYTQQFGETHADEMAALKDEYFRLCAIRKPEHMSFNLSYYNPKVRINPIQDSGWSPEKVQELLDRWGELARRTEALAGMLPPESRDAYFQLMEYPNCAAAAMVEKILLAERARQTGSEDYAKRSAEALARIEQLTERYNSQKDGKWRHMMDHSPRNLPVFSLPPTTREAWEAIMKTSREPIPMLLPVAETADHVVEAAAFQPTQDREGAGWRLIEGLGPRGAALAVLPHQDKPTLRTPEDILAQAPMAEAVLDIEFAGQFELTVEASPTHPFSPHHKLLVALSIDGGQPEIVRFDMGEDHEYDPTWHVNVTRGAMIGQTTLTLPAGASTLKLWAADRGVVVQRITLQKKELQSP